MRSNKREKVLLRKKVSVSELAIQNYINDLFGNPDFISDIIKIRKDHSIPPQGYEAKQMWVGGHWNNKLKTDLYFFSEDMEKIQVKYNLPLIWTREIKEWILTNKFSFEAINRSTMISVYDLKTIVDELGSGNETYRDMGISSLRTASRDQPVAIVIHPSMSKTAILDFVTRNYENKIKPIQEQYRLKESLIGKVRSKNTDTQKMKKMVMELYEKGEKSKNITEAINREFSVSKHYTDINTIIRKQKKIKL